MARLEGFEPPTYGLEVRCSIQLSYRRMRCATKNLVTDWQCETLGLYVL